MDRRTHYTDIALSLFLEHGFYGVSMDQLVAAAGGSKATLYRYFDSKEALFGAIIDVIAAAGAPVEDDEDWGPVALEDGLRQLTRATAAAALDERTIGLMRLALGEHTRFPQLGRALYERGPAATYARLRRFLAAKRDAGELKVDDLVIAAEQILGGVIGHQQLRAALGAGTPTKQDIEARVDASVEAFVALHGIAPAGR